MQSARNNGGESFAAAHAQRARPRRVALGAI